MSLSSPRPSPPCAAPAERALITKLILVGAALVWFDVLPGHDGLHIAQLALLTLHGVVSVGVLMRWVWRRWWRALWVLPAPLLLAIPGLLGAQKVIRYEGAFGAHVVVEIDAEGDAFGDDYPPRPKVLIRAGRDQGQAQYFFRPLYFGALIGQGRTPYDG